MPHDHQGGVDSHSQGDLGAVLGVVPNTGSRSRYLLWDAGAARGQLTATEDRDRFTAEALAEMSQLSPITPSMPAIFAPRMKAMKLPHEEIHL